MIDDAMSERRFLGRWDGWILGVGGSDGSGYGFAVWDLAGCLVEVGLY